MDNNTYAYIHIQTHIHTSYIHAYMNTGIYMDIHDTYMYKHILLTPLLRHSCAWKTVCLGPHVCVHF